MNTHGLKVRVGKVVYFSNEASPFKADSIINLDDNYDDYDNDIGGEYLFDTLAFYVQKRRAAQVDDICYTFAPNVLAKHWNLAWMLETFGPISANDPPLVTAGDMIFTIGGQGELIAIDHGNIAHRTGQIDGHILIVTANWIRVCPMAAAERLCYKLYHVELTLRKLRVEWNDNAFDIVDPSQWHTFAETNGLYMPPAEGQVPLIAEAVSPVKERRDNDEQAN